MTRRKLYQQALRGDAEAQYKLACDYDFEPPRDIARAKRWYETAAEQGHAEAQNALGELLRDGSSGRPNRKKAFPWFLAAAKQGQADAQVSVGYAYFYGEGAPKDQEEALRWYRRAARQKHPRACFNIARLYHAGDVLPHNIKNASAWYIKAAQQDHEASCYWLGEIYSEKKSQAHKAVFWFKKGIELGDIDCMISLGVMFHNGKLIPKDWKESFAYYQRAAELGNTWATYLMGLCYRDGEGTKKNLRLARSCFKKAAPKHKEARAALKKLQWKP